MRLASSILFRDTDIGELVAEYSKVHRRWFLGMIISKDSIYWFDINYSDDGSNVEYMLPALTERLRTSLLKGVKKAVRSKARQ